MSEHQKNTLSVEAARALFEGQIQGLIVTVYQNERPLAGLSGILDWYFHGAISRCIQKGAVTGQQGECTYFPFSNHGTTLHIILAGSGQSSSPGERDGVPTETFHLLQKNLVSLKLPKMGISKADFGQITQEYLNKHLKGVPLWITP